MWPIFTASGPTTSILPGRRRRRAFSEEQIDAAALEKLERAGARWLQRTDGTWARWSYLGSEWVDQTPPPALAAQAGTVTDDTVWTDEDGRWAVSTTPPPAVVGPPASALLEQVGPSDAGSDELGSAPAPGDDPRKRVEAGEPAVGDATPLVEEFAVAAMAATVGLFIAYLVREALSLFVEPIPVTVFVPWLWKAPVAQPGIGETVRGLLLLSVALSAAWVGLRRMLMAYRMPAMLAGLVSLGLVAALWLVGFMLGRPV